MTSVQEKRKPDDSIPSHDLIESAPNAVVVVDDTGSILLANVQAEEVFGYSRHELAGQPIEILIPQRFHPRHLIDRNNFIAAPRARSMAQSVASYGRRKDGSEFPAEIDLSPVRMDCRLCVMAIVRDITERKRFDVTLRYQMAELTMLHKVTMAVVDATSEDDLLARATEIIGEIFYPDNFGVVLMDARPLAQGLRPHPSYYGVSAAKKESAINLGEGVIGRVAASGAAMRATDTRLAPDHTPFAEKTLSLMCVPLKTGDKVIGVINVERKQLDAFSQDEERLLITIAGQLAAAIARLRSTAEEMQRTTELEAMARVTAALRDVTTRAEMLPIILDELVELFRADDAVIGMRDPSTGETVIELTRGKRFADQMGQRSPAGIGLGGYVISTGQPHLSSDLRNEPRFPLAETVTEPSASICIPLIAKDATMGMLWLTRPTPFVYDQLWLLTAIGDIAAAAIYRATLFEQTEQRARRLAAMRAVDVAIRSSFDARDSLMILLTQALDLLKADAADVLLFDEEAQALKYFLGLGFRSNAIRQTHLQLGEGRAGLAALERRLIVTPSLSASSHARAQLLAEEKFESGCVAPLVIKNQVKGVLEIFHRQTLTVDRDWLEFFEAFANQAAVAVDHAELFSRLESSSKELALAYEATLEGWARALDLRDRETEGHTRRVTDMTERLARAMGVDEERVGQMRRGALLHDVGKLGIPDSILLKEGKLTQDEQATMRKHPTYAYKMLSSINYLHPALDIPYYHHEKWDGTGYPGGLKGEAIPLAARIFAIVDVWDALSVDRPYRVAWSQEKVKSYLREQAGLYFDPQVVEAFLKVLSEDR
jgi:PAS domain S-box-containing protein